MLIVCVQLNDLVMALSPMFISSGVIFAQERQYYYYNIHMLII